MTPAPTTPAPAEYGRNPHAAYPFGAFAAQATLGVRLASTAPRERASA